MFGNDLYLSSGESYRARKCIQILDLRVPGVQDKSVFMGHGDLFFFALWSSVL